MWNGRRHPAHPVPAGHQVHHRVAVVHLPVHAGPARRHPAAVFPVLRVAVVHPAAGVQVHHLRAVFLHPPVAAALQAPLAAHRAAHRHIKAVRPQARVVAVPAPAHPANRPVVQVRPRTVLCQYRPHPAAAGPPPVAVAAHPPAAAALHRRAAAHGPAAVPAHHPAAARLLQVQAQAAVLQAQARQAVVHHPAVPPLKRRSI